MQMKNGQPLVIKTDPLGRVYMAEILRLVGCDRKTLAHKMRQGRFPKPANHNDHVRGQAYLWDYAAVIAWVQVQPGV